MPSATPTVRTQPILLALLTLLLTTALAPPVSSRTEDGASDNPLLDILQAELDDTMKMLEAPDGTRPYYVAFTVTESQRLGVSCSLGALNGEGQGTWRTLDVDVRVGDYDLDNTHKLRGDGGSRHGGQGSNVSIQLPIENDTLAIRHEIWLATDRAFKAAMQEFQNVETNLKTTVEEDDTAGDFSREEPETFVGQPASVELDLPTWVERLRNVSRLARSAPLIYNSTIALEGSATNRYMVTSEGTRLLTGNKLLRVSVSASSKAEDGMELSKSTTFDTASEGALPTEEQLVTALQHCIDMTLALREAPLVEPFTGPAILLNRASGVFFHEIFGHRIEGHRQRDVEEGQTFTKKVDEVVLPEFLSVHDDPTLARFGDEDLRGHYLFDDEGVKAQSVALIDNGVLKTFLLSRQPVQEFKTSNGHGRRNPGRKVVARQGNLTVRSTRATPLAELREALKAECVRQEREYGLLFEDIAGGFTTTGRGGPQAFKVLPVVVWRVFADGRADELVRGVDIVGTPLQCFSNILMTGDDSAVFNGTCGAESGWVPVSAVSPSILVSEIEIEKREREQDRLPILSAPISELKEGDS